MAKTILLNPLPRPTFSWLQSNHTEDELWQKGSNAAEIKVSAGEGLVKELTDKSLVNNNFKGANAEALAEVADNFTHGFEITVPSGKDERVELFINLDGEGICERTRIRVNAEEKARLELQVILKGGAETENSVQLFTEVVTAEGAKVLIRKVQLLGENSQHIEHRYSDLAASSTVEYINLELGSKTTYLNFLEDLTGAESRVEHDLAYLGNKEQRYDFAVQMVHHGKKTTSEIRNIGALDGVSKKSFRGTLDFQRGCGGAEGAEEDTCLLLNPNVKSISLPLLLCKEDDVSGNHASSAGQLDHNKLFYLMSRGFDEVEAKHIIVESMLRPIIDKIGNEAIEAEALALVREKIN